MEPKFEALRQALGRDREAMLDRWIASLTRRAWQIRRREREIAQLRERCANFIEALDRTLGQCSELSLGSVEWREPLHQLSFAAGWMAGVQMPVTAAVALGLGLRDALGAGPDALYEELTLVAAEAHNAGVRQQAAATHRDVIEKSQVVCTFRNKLPCLFLVGDPDRQAVDDAVARLMTIAVIREAPTMIVDASGLLQPEVTLVQALGILADHRCEPPPQVLLSSVTKLLAERLTEVERPNGLRFFEQLADAVVHAEKREGEPT